MAEAAVEDTAETPISGNGMFNLPLRASQSSDKRRFTHRITALEAWLDEQRETCHQNAIRNLIGVLQYYMGNRMKALSYFNLVLESDPDNLNALGNSSFVYRRIGRKSKAVEADRRLQEALESNPQVAVIRARYWAEQAHALSNEILGGTRHLDYDLKANSYYQTAFCLAGEEFCEDELSAWQFSAAINYRRLCKKWDMPETERRESFQNSLKLFHEVLKRKESPYLADCWCEIGGLFDTSANDDLFAWKGAGSLVRKYNLEEYHDQPKKCFEKALETSSANWRFVNKYARYLYHRKGSGLWDALEKINISLKDQLGERNWFGYNTRAEICMYLCRQDDRFVARPCKYTPNMLDWNPKAQPYLERARELQREMESGTSTESSVGQEKEMHQAVNSFREALLLHARKDMGDVVEWNPTAKGCLVKAKVCYDLALLAEKPSCLFDQRMEEALEMFQYACDMEMQGQEKIPYLHYEQGNCQRDADEYRNAAESYKICLEMNVKSKHCKAPLVRLIDSLLFLVKDEETEAELSILHEAAYWLLRTCLKYKATNFLKSLQIKDLHVRNRYKLPLLVEITRKTRYGHRAHTCSVASTLESKLGQLNPRWSDAAAGPVPGTPQSPFDNREKQEDEHKAIPHAPTSARNQTGKKFDFYVYHTSQDRFWVYYGLLPKFEQEYNFKGCIGQRDLTRNEGPGALTNQITEVIDQSVCMLLVLTKAFCEHLVHDQKRLNELRKIVEAKYPVIPIRLEECDIPGEMRFITYLDYVESVEYCDWYQLVCSLDKLMEI